jgi:cytochrome o ubiquinol oxidase subunit II
MRDHSTLVSFRRLAAPAALLLGAGLLAGCSGAVLDPAGDVARQQRDIIYISTALMLVIIVPVMALTAVFAWRYRRGNQDATYDPDFDHSTGLELVIWSAPLLIVIALGALTWWSTHLLDPYRPLGRVSAEKPIDPKARPLVVQVVALDWKWLFIYPEQGVASVNELVDRQVRFDLTSTNMMNTFYAPTLAGMIYVMPGMRSTMHAVLNRPGSFKGYSANYSGAGFSGMRFRLQGVDQAGFDGWVAKVKSAPRVLDAGTFLRLEQPSEKVPVTYFGRVAPALFDRAYQRCVKPGTTCMGEVMLRDQQAGGGGGGDPRLGTGMPAGRTSVPPPGQKPEGGLFKDDAGPTGTHNTVPKKKPSGSTAPADPNNRDMSFLPSRPAASVRAAV